MPRTWTKEQEAFLIDNHDRLEYAEIAELLGKTECAVKSKARKLEIRKRVPITDAEYSKIRELYPYRPTAEVAEIVGRSVCTINNVAFRLGLRKDPKYMDAMLKEISRNLQESGKSHRFPKGHVPMNKGIRMPGWAPGRMSETQFKKGQFSANRREIGDERTDRDGYVYVKVADGKKNLNWKQKHRIVWEQHNGPVAPGTNIIFKDGDKRNCDISNLMAVSDAELMNRNTFHNYPEPIKAQIHILAGYRRKLNRYAEKQAGRS